MAVELPADPAPPINVERDAALKLTGDIRKTLITALPDLQSSQVTITPLCLALAMRRPDTAARLIERDTTVDDEISEGVRPLHIACGAGHEGLAARLLFKGASATIPDIRGNSPLHWAVREGREKCLEPLLNHGADINARNSGGQTALMIAAQHGNADLVGELLDLGADKAVTATDGRTAFVLAADASTRRLLNVDPKWPAGLEDWSEETPLQTESNQWIRYQCRLLGDEDDRENWREVDIRILPQHHRIWRFTFLERVGEKDLSWRIALAVHDWFGSETETERHLTLSASNQPVVLRVGHRRWRFTDAVRIMIETPGHKKKRILHTIGDMDVDEHRHDVEWLARNKPGALMAIWRRADRRMRGAEAHSRSRHIVDRAQVTRILKRYVDGTRALRRFETESLSYAKQLLEEPVYGYGRIGLDRPEFRLQALILGCEIEKWQLDAQAVSIIEKILSFPEEIMITDSMLFSEERDSGQLIVGKTWKKTECLERWSRREGAGRTGSL